MATSLSQPPSQNNNSGDAAVALLSDVESFLSDLESRGAVTGTVMIKQANLLDKIRAIHNDTPTSATTNHNHSNGHATLPSSQGRKESNSSGEETYDDTAAVGSRSPPLSPVTPTGPSPSSYVIKSVEPIEYEDVMVEKSKKKPKTSTSGNGVTKAPSDTISAEKAASDTAHSGYLVKKSKSLLAKLSSGRKWCVLTRQGVLYCFEKNSSKTPMDSIQVKEFQCVPASGELSKKQDFAFTLSNAKKTHMFAASSTEDFAAWMEALNKMCVTCSAGFSTIGPASAIRPAAKPSIGDYEEAFIAGADLDEDLYSSVPEELALPAVKAQPVTHKSPPQTTPVSPSKTTPPEKPKEAPPERPKNGPPPAPLTAPPPLPTSDTDEVLYDDTSAMASPAEQVRKPPPVTPAKQEADEDEEDEEEQLYDDAMTSVKPPSASLPSLPPPQSTFTLPPSTVLPAAPQSSPPQLQLRRNPGMAKGTAICHSIDVIDDDPSDPLYPPLPPRQFSSEQRDDENVKDTALDLSPSCLYVAKWEWTQGQACQLTFRRGQLLQVVSKQHEQYGWWTMTDGHVTGMVPCSYLAVALTDA